MLRTSRKQRAPSRGTCPKAVKTPSKHQSVHTLVSNAICHVSTDYSYKTSSPSFNRVYTNTGVQRSSLTHTSACLQKRELSASDITRSSLQQVNETALLNAYVTVTAKDALAQALESDEHYLAPGKTPRSALEGIPIAIKDNFNYKGTKTTAGSQFLDSYVSDYNATVVQRLRDGGSVIIGKTNLDEFGMGSHGINSGYGPTLSSFDAPESYAHSGREAATATEREKSKTSSATSNTTGRPAGDQPNNPLHLSRYTPGIYSPGGSSSGSAVSVSQYTVYAAIGSDTGGSVRLPAAYTGLVGLKPTYGVVSRHGLIAYASSFDTPGILTRTAQDARAVFDVIAGADPMDSTCIFNPVKSHAPFMNPLVDPVLVQSKSDGNDGVVHQKESSSTANINGRQYKCYSNTTDRPLDGLRVGIPQSLMFSDISPAVLETWDITANVLKKLGADVVTIPLEDLASLEYALSAYYTLVQSEAVANLARYDGVRYGKTHYTNQSDYVPRFYSSLSQTNLAGGEANAQQRQDDEQTKHLDNVTPMTLPNRQSISSQQKSSSYETDSADNHQELSDSAGLPNASALQKLYSTNRQLFFGDEVKTRLTVGNFVSSSESYASYVGKAMDIREQVTDELLSVLTPITAYTEENAHRSSSSSSSSSRTGVDLLLFPTSTRPPLTFHELDKLNEKDSNSSYIDDIMTVIANLAGLPAISFPATTITKRTNNNDSTTDDDVTVHQPTLAGEHRGDDESHSTTRLPVAMQLLGAPLTEDQLLHVVEAYQQYTRL